MATPGETWAAWLRDQFDRHPKIRRSADLVRASGTKQNGRPVIDASTVTQWLRGRRPSFELATVTATAFGRDPLEALHAAGYNTTAPPDGKASTKNVGPPTEDPVDEEEDTLLYRRPEGLSDEEWEQVKRESRGFIEWQISRAAGER